MNKLLLVTFAALGVAFSVPHFGVGTARAADPPPCGSIPLPDSCTSCQCQGSITRLGCIGGGLKHCTRWIVGCCASPGHADDCWYNTVEECDPDGGTLCPDCVSDASGRERCSST